MISLLSKVKILDNSGGLVGRCIKVLKPGKNGGIVGDIIVISVLDSIVSNNQKSNMVQKGDVQKAIIVRVKKNSTCR
jgi:ribosomal protein L14